NGRQKKGESFLTLLTLPNQPLLTQCLSSNLFSIISLAVPTCKNAFASRPAHSNEEIDGELSKKGSHF
ncbi:MAG TPA: hypothetical protein VFG46_18955, partial [Chryseolinea sp.]|nr:hypothetical protein [Chryseolinea sp.]